MIALPQFPLKTIITLTADATEDAKIREAFNQALGEEATQRYKWEHCHSQDEVSSAMNASHIPISAIILSSHPLNLDFVKAVRQKAPEGRLYLMEHGAMREDAKRAGIDEVINIGDYSMLAKIFAASLRAPRRE